MKNNIYSQVSQVFSPSFEEREREEQASSFCCGPLSCISNSRGSRRQRQQQQQDQRDSAADNNHSTVAFMVRSHVSRTRFPLSQSSPGKPSIQHQFLIRMQVRQGEEGGGSKCLSSTSLVSSSWTRKRPHSGSRRQMDEQQRRQESQAQVEAAEANNAGMQCR